MRVPPKAARWVGLGLLAALVVALVVRIWVVPAAIAAAIRGHYGGRVEIASWWLGRTSLGLRGLVLREGTDRDAPAWLSVESAATDLGLTDLLRGRFTPGQLTLRRPQVAIRLDRDGGLATRIPVRPVGGGGASAIPRVAVQGARVVIRRAGRAESMVVSGIDAGVRPDSTGRLDLTGQAADPTWGRWAARGAFDLRNGTGAVRLDGRQVTVDRARAQRLVFVPEEVWRHAMPDGPVDVAVEVQVRPRPAPPVDMRTTIACRGTTVALPSLGVVARGATGRLTVAAGRVQLEGLRGEALGGRVTADGMLDLGREPQRFDVALGLDSIHMADAPPSWQLSEAGVTGRLTGTAQLRAVLTPSGVDLSGSSGQAVVEGGTLEGIPVKRMQLTMTAEGDDLHYHAGSSARPSAQLAVLLSWLVALQAMPPPAPPPPPSKPPRPGPSGLRLPRAITTDIELEDVDLTQILGRVEAMGVHLPYTVAGRASVKASLTIPLGALRDLKAYTIHGSATLTGADIADVDLGRVEARIGLEKGVLELTDFRGRLVDRPTGSLTNLPQPTEAVPAEGPLPPGGFRGRLRAELSPPGRLTARFEGEQLPLGELAAPVLPHPTPLAGLVTATIQAEAGVARLADPAGWTVDGRVTSQRIAYRGATLDRIDAQLGVAAGRLTIRELTARLADQPLAASGQIGLAAPHEFQGQANVSGWNLSDVLAFLPQTGRSAPVDGALTARIEAGGALTLRAIRATGSGQIERFRAGPLALGVVPFQLKTDQDGILLTSTGARPFGGTLALGARVPTAAGQPIRADVQFQDIDTAALSAALPEAAGLTLTGRARGTIAAVYRTAAPPDVPPLKANLTLSAPELTVRGIPARSLRGVVTVRNGAVVFDLYAESLGGKIGIKGSLPLSGRAALPEPLGDKAGPRATPAAEARIRAIGFALPDLWRALQIEGAAGDLRGLGAIDTTLTLAPGTWEIRSARGVAELREVSWGAPALPLGWVQGTITLDATGWQLVSLTGALLGGTVRGSAQGGPWSARLRPTDFALTVNRADLAPVLAVVPGLGRRRPSGTATLRVAGRLDDALRATAEVFVERAQVRGIELDELRLPAELSYTGGNGMIEVRDGRARLAGGQIRAQGRFRFGAERSYQGALQLEGLALEAITRTLSDTSRPASGRISGRATFSGPDPARLDRLQGRITLDLDDANVLELPVFRELNRFFGGAARGGLFEDGGLQAAIAHRQLVIDQLTLAGRFAQMYASGKVGFDRRLDLDVLLNTSQIISQTGQGLVRLIPGLDPARTRRDEAIPLIAGFLSDRLLKIHVGGTINTPEIQSDPSVLVTNAAVLFFGAVFQVPLELFR